MLSRSGGGLRRHRARAILGSKQVTFNRVRGDASDHQLALLTIQVAIKDHGLSCALIAQPDRPAIGHHPYPAIHAEVRQLDPSQAKRDSGRQLPTVVLAHLKGYPSNAGLVFYDPPSERGPVYPIRS